MKLDSKGNGKPRAPLNRGELAKAVEEADLRILLMVLIHMTADPKWFRILPKRDVRLIADESAGLSPSDQREIRDAAVEILSADIEPAIADPGDAQMLQMMRLCLGETVPSEYAPLMREELGFISSEVHWRNDRPPAAARRHVIIVGAGVSGLALARQLHGLGIDFTIIERNDEVGGVWLENRYPGAGVDTPSHSYSFSFGPPFAWPSYFSSRDHILEYIKGCARTLGFRQKIRFNTEVLRASWDESAALWRVAVATPHGEEELEANILVSAIGQFSEPSIPDIPGMAQFRGPCFHSACWPEDFRVEGKQLAIIGTGASAMQIVPSVVDRAGGLDVYQRTAQWARPIERYHDQISAGSRWLIEHVPFYAQWLRFTMWWRYGDGLFAQLRKDPDWAHPARSINSRNDRHRQEMTDYIQRQLEDRPDLVAKCVPTYPPFGKRILLDNGWYQAIKHDHVQLVNEGIERFTADGVVTRDGRERKADAVVFATGFQMTQMAARLNITGRHARSLAVDWAGDDPKAYLGITVPAFPNLFLMQGPNAGLGHGGSAIFQAESQARYISACVVEMIERDLASIEVRQEAHDRFIEKVDAEHEQLIWTHPGMSTYYRNSRGRVVTIMPFRLVDYWRMTHEADLQHYHQRPHFASAAASLRNAGRGRLSS